MIAHDGLQQQVYRKERQGGRYRRDEHAARSGNSDENAIEDKCRNARNGYRYRPIKVRFGRLYHKRFVGKQAKESVSAHRINQCKSRCHGGTPTKQGSHKSDERLTVAGSVVLSAKGFARISKAIHHVREQGKERHQQSIYRQNDVSLPRSGRYKEEIHAN